VAGFRGAPGVILDRAGVRVEGSDAWRGQVKRTRSAMLGCRRIETIDEDWRLEAKPALDACASGG
jgi:glycine oxidase